MVTPTVLECGIQPRQLRSSNSILLFVSSVKTRFGTRGLEGLKTPSRLWGVLNPPVFVANITVKDNVYRPTSELQKVMIIAHVLNGIKTNM